MIANTTDIEILISKIRSGKTGRDEVLVMLYHDQVLRNKVKSITIKYGGQSIDNDSIFNTTLMQFVKTVIRKKDIEIQGNLHSYILGIAKYTLLKDRNKERKLRIDPIDQQYNLQTEQTPESLIINKSKVEILNGLLLKLGKNCKEVLMYWANGYSMKEIAKMMKYKSDMMAKKKKYKCFKELLNYLEKHPEIKNVLR